MQNTLDTAYPELGRRLRHVSLAELPTPVSNTTVRVGTKSLHLSVKHDDQTATYYGGNKVRKLEYLLQRAKDRGAKRLATFGAVASNHAVATALYAKRQGFACTCFLSPQRSTPLCETALRLHLMAGTELVPFVGDAGARRRTLRQHLRGRHASVIPLGGSSWLGTIGFVNAGLELARQISAGACDAPTRIYVPLGTMGTATGVALGLALAKLDTELHAVRVTSSSVANRTNLERLLQKTATLMRSFDAAIPAELASRARIVVREEFFGDGYARSNPATEDAIAFAAGEIGITLESTYTGKTMAALLSDLRGGYDGPALFWHTYNSRPLPVDENIVPSLARLPAEFRRYIST